jgi:nucleotide-binding universal stress UspA family protein
MTQILVAIDLSPGSDEALRQAAALANRSNASLTVLHIMPDVVRINALFPQANANAAVDSAELEGRIKQAVTERVASVIPDAHARSIVEAGTDYVRILEHAESSKMDWLVVGAHGRSANKVLGGVAEKVIRYAHCPVLVARPSNEKGCVVAGTDLSDPAAPAVAAAARESTLRGVPLLVVHAIDTTLAGYFAMFGMAFGGSSVVPGAEKGARDAIRAVITEMIEKAGAKGEAVIADGPADREILRLAEDRRASLVVVATHGHTGLRRVALGSTAERVIRGSGCSVLVVRL